MATQPRTRYGPGGFDPNKPQGNVVEQATDTIPDLPAGVPAALGALRNRLTGTGQQPTDAQAINALIVVVARMVLPMIENG